MYDANFVLSEMFGMDEPTLTQCQALAHGLREYERKLAAQVRPLMEYFQSVAFKSAIQGMRESVAPFLKLADSARYQATVTNGLDWLRRVDCADLTAKIRRMDSARLGADIVLPTRAPEPKFKPRPPIGFRPPR